MSNITIMSAVSLADLQSEQKFSVATSNRINRVKVEKGQQLRVRILPYPMGAKGTFYARLAQHWMNVGGKPRPVPCKRNTSVEFGGDPTYECPLCGAINVMYANAQTDAEKKAASAMNARLSYLVYCLVLEKVDERGKVETYTEPATLTPWEFNIPKSSFELLQQKLDRSRARPGAPKLGLLDLENGSDLWAVRTAKNDLTFDFTDEERQPAVAAANTEEFDSKMAKVWRPLKQPVVTFLPDDRLESIARKIEESKIEEAGQLLANNNSPRGAGRANFREQGQQAPAGTGRWSGTHEVDAEAEQAPVTRTLPVTAAPVAEVDDAPEPVQEEAPTIRATRTAGTTARPVVATVAPVQQTPPPAVSAARRASVPPPPPARRVAPVTATTTAATTTATASAPVNTGADGVSEEEDTAPEEVSDPAPPVQETLAPAPAPEQVRVPSTGNLPSALRSRIGALKQRGA